MAHSYVAGRVGEEAEATKDVSHATAVNKSRADVPMRTIRIQINQWHKLHVVSFPHNESYFRERTIY